MDEQQLIKGCIDNDRKAQKSLYDKYSRRMMGVCMRYVKDVESARDVLQEGFLKLFTNLDKYSGSGSFDGWVRKIFVNCALESLRSNDILKEASDIDDVSFMDLEESSSVEDISADDLLTYIKSLPEGYRTAFNLFAVEGYSHREIGEMLNISEVTSRSQYMRARKMLQKRILNR
jgi:RNA polymerase sigma-70 factor (ECF subfamily)